MRIASKFLSIFFLVLFLIPTIIIAHEGHDHSDDHQTPKKSKIVAKQKGKKCKALGLANIGEYIRTNEFQCFRSKAKAESAGYIDAMQGVLSQTPTQVYQHLVEVNLSAQEAVPPSSSVSTGSCKGVMDHIHNTLSLVCNHNISNFTMGHIHQGFAGQTGAMKCGSPHVSNVVGFFCQLDPQTHSDLHAGRLYVNLHSTDFPTGELRGQIAAP